MSHNNHWMPFYVCDYLADTGHLTGAEHGAYVLLLMHSWRTGPLPDDDRTLATIARTDWSAWRRMAPTIRAFFTSVDGRLVQARLERVRMKQGKKVEQKSAAGKASDAARKAQRNVNERSTDVELPLPSCAKETEIEEEKKEPSLRSGRSPTSPALPSAGPALPPSDARSALFSEGVERAVRLTGKPPKAMRGLLSKWLQAAADDAALVSLVLTEAEQLRPADPIAWVTAALQARTGQRPKFGKPNALDGWLAKGREPAMNFDLDGVAEELMQ